MDLLASILEKETAEPAKVAASAEGRRDNSYQESNKKQKMDIDDDRSRAEAGVRGNGVSSSSSNGGNSDGGNTDGGIATGTGANLGGSAEDAVGARSLGAAEKVTGAAAPTPLATTTAGINLVNRAKERGEDDHMDVDVNVKHPAQSTDSATSAKTATITQPQTSTEAEVKDIIASPAYREILQQREERERASAESVPKQVVQHPSGPPPSASTSTSDSRTAPDSAASDSAASAIAKTATTATTIPSIPSSLPNIKDTFAAVAAAVPTSTSNTAPHPPTVSTTMTTTPTPAPIPTGRARTAEYINRLYHLCSIEGLGTPIFEFETVAFVPFSLFTATLSVDGLTVGSGGAETIKAVDAGGSQGGKGAAGAVQSPSTQNTANEGSEDKGAFRSKKEAKEAAAERGYWALTRLVEDGVIGKKARGQVGTVVDAQKQQEGPKENWIGLLQEFCSKTGTPNPVTQEYILGTRFACETFISQRSKDSSDDPSGNGDASTNADANSDPSVNGIPFGGRDKLFPSKKAARHNAAAEAVAWLKENGYYSTVTGKPVARPDKGRKGGSDKNGGGSGGNEDGNEEDSGYVGMKKGMSYGQMVAEYCHHLALPQPEYHFQNTPNAPPGFLTGAAYFMDHPEFDGPVGEVRNVYGKKAAKQECARAVAGVLSDLLAEQRGLK